MADENSNRVFGEYPATDNSSWGLDGSPTTSEALTKQHIHWLQSAWKQSQDELQLQQQANEMCEMRITSLNKEVAAHEVLRDVSDRKLQLSQVFATSSDNPFVLNEALANLLPCIQSADESSNTLSFANEPLRLILLCLVKAGDNWIAISSSSSYHEEFIFSSSRLDNFVKYKMSSGTDGSFIGVIERQAEVLPAQLIDFIASGKLPVVGVETIVHKDSLADDRSGQHQREALFFRSSLDDAHRSLFVVLPAPGAGNALLPLFEVRSLDHLLELLVQPATVPQSEFDRDVLAVSSCFEYALPLMMSSVLRSFQETASSSRHLRSKLVNAVQDTLSHKSKDEDKKQIWKAAADSIATTLGNHWKEITRSHQNQSASRHTIHCDFLVTSGEACRGSLMLSSQGEILNVIDLTADETLLHSSFEHAMATAVTTAIERQKPHVESYSKAVPLLPAYSSERGSRSMSPLISFEHRIYLAVPLRSEQIAGVVLVQFVYHDQSEGEETIFSSPTHRTASLRSQRPFSLSLISSAAYGISGQVADFLVDYLVKTNFRPLCLFHLHDPANDAEGHGSEVSVIEGIAGMLRRFSHLASHPATAADLSETAPWTATLCSTFEADWAVAMLVSQGANDLVLQTRGALPMERRSVESLPAAYRRAVTRALEACSVSPALSSSSMSGAVVLGDADDLSVDLQDTIELLRIKDSFVRDLHQLGDGQALDKAIYHHTQCICLRHKQLEPALVVCMGRMLRGSFGKAGATSAVGLSAVAKLFNVAALLYQSEVTTSCVAAKERSESRESSILSEKIELDKALLRIHTDFLGRGKDAASVLQFRRAVFTAVEESFLRVLSLAIADHCPSTPCTEFLLSQTGDVAPFVLSRQSFEFVHAELPVSGSHLDVCLLKWEKPAAMLDGASSVRSMMLTLRSSISHAVGFDQMRGASPALDAWLLCAGSFIQQHQERLLRLPAGTPIKPIDDDVDSVVLRVLSHTMLQSSRVAEGFSQSLLRPYYHLHDYLHSHLLLHALQSFAPLSDFVVLPITSFPSKQGSAEQSTALNKVEQDRLFKHLLRFDDGEEHREVAVHLPVKLSQTIHMIHSAVEKRHFSSQLASKHYEETLSNSKRRGGYFEMVHQQFEGTVLSSTSYECTAHSLLCELHDANSVMWNYFYELDDHLDDKLCEYLVGKESFEQTFSLSRASVDSRLNSSTLDYLLDGARSKVMLYSPLYPTSVEQPDERNSRTLLHPWATHYLLVSKKDRPVTSAHFSELQRVLDQVFHASQIVAAGQPWFECVKGIEQLLIATTSMHTLHTRAAIGQQKDLEHSSFGMIDMTKESSATPPDQIDTFVAQDREHSGSLVFSQAQSILQECAKIIKLSLGGMFIGATPYLLPSEENMDGVDQASPFVQLVKGNENGSLDNGEVCSSDIGPRTLTAPASSESIRTSLGRHYDGLTVDRHVDMAHNLAHFEYTFNSRSRSSKGSAGDNSYPANIPLIHYVEVSARQFNDQLQAFHRSRNPTSPEDHSFRRSLLRDDVNVLQVFITSCFDQDESDDSGSGAQDRVIACLVVLLHTQASPANPQRGRSNKARAAHNSIEVALGGELWRNILRVVDISGALLSSLYLQSRKKIRMQARLYSHIEQLRKEKKHLYHLLQSAAEWLSADRKHVHTDSQALSSSSMLSGAVESSESTFLQDLKLLCADECFSFAQGFENEKSGEKNKHTVWQFFERLRDHLLRSEDCKAKLESALHRYTALGADHQQTTQNYSLVSDCLRILLSHAQNTASFSSDLTTSEELHLPTLPAQVATAVVSLGQLQAVAQKLLSVIARNNLHGDFSHDLQGMITRLLRQSHVITTMTDIETLQVAHAQIGKLHTKQVLGQGSIYDDSFELDGGSSSHPLRVDIIWCYDQRPPPPPQQQQQQQQQQPSDHPTHGSGLKHEYLFSKEAVLRLDAFEDCLHQRKPVASSLVKDEATHRRVQNKNVLHLQYIPFFPSAPSPCTAVLQISSSAPIDADILDSNPGMLFHLSVLQEILSASLVSSFEGVSGAQDLFYGPGWVAMSRLLGTAASLTRTSHGDGEHGRLPLDGARLHNISIALSELLRADATAFTVRNSSDFQELAHKLASSSPHRFSKAAQTGVFLSTKTMSQLHQLLRHLHTHRQRDGDVDVLCAACEFDIFEDSAVEVPDKEQQENVRYLYYAVLPLAGGSGEGEREAGHAHNDYLVLLAQISRLPLPGDLAIIDTVMQAVSCDHTLQAQHIQIRDLQREVSSLSGSLGQQSVILHGMGDLMDLGKEVDEAMDELTCAATRSVQLRPQEVLDAISDFERRVASLNDFVSREEILSRMVGVSLQTEIVSIPFGHLRNAQMAYNWERPAPSSLAGVQRRFWAVDDWRTAQSGSASVSSPSSARPLSIDDLSALAALSGTGVLDASQATIVIPLGDYWAVSESWLPFHLLAFRFSNVQALDSFVNKLTKGQRAEVFWRYIQRLRGFMHDHLLVFSQMLHVVTAQGEQAIGRGLETCLTEVLQELHRCTAVWTKSSHSLDGEAIEVLSSVAALSRGLSFAASQMARTGDWTVTSLQLHWQQGEDWLTCLTPPSASALSSRSPTLLSRRGEAAALSPDEQQIYAAMSNAATPALPSRHAEALRAARDGVLCVQLPPQEDKKHVAVLILSQTCALEIALAVDTAALVVSGDGPISVLINHQVDQSFSRCLTDLSSSTTARPPFQHLLQDLQISLSLLTHLLPTSLELHRKAWQSGREDLEHQTAQADCLTEVLRLVTAEGMQLQDLAAGLLRAIVQYYVTCQSTLAAATLQARNDAGGKLYSCTFPESLSDPGPFSPIPAPASTFFSPLTTARSSSGRVFTFSPTPMSQAIAAETPRSAFAFARIHDASHEAEEVVFDCNEIQGVLSLTFSTPPSRLSEERVLWEVVCRALARRTFELYRGKRNKELLQSKHRELHQKSSQLEEQAQRVLSLEQLQSMTSDELQGALKESEALRRALTHDRQSLALALKAKQTLNAQLKQSLSESRTELLSKEKAFSQEKSDLLKRINALLQEVGKRTDEVTTLQQRDLAHRESRQQLQRDHTRMTQQYELAERHIAGLRKELDGLRRQCASMGESEDAKVKGLLGKIRSLEDDISRQRGGNDLLKKQLDGLQKQLQKWSPSPRRPSPTKSLQVAIPDAGEGQML